MSTPPPASFDFDRAKLPWSYDVARLQQEVGQAVAGTRPYIYYSVLPLTQPQGRAAHVTDYSDPDWTTWVETPFLDACPYVREILDSLDCRKTNVRLCRLEAGAELKEHTDPQLDLALRNQVRLHVPVFTDESVRFFLNGTIVPMNPGELWYMRLSDRHSVTHAGRSERVHLSIDVVVNDWVEESIAEAARCHGTR